MQALGRMVIDRVTKGKCCKIPLGGHQVGPSLIIHLNLLVLADENLVALWSSCAASSILMVSVPPSKLKYKGTLDIQHSFVEEVHWL